MADFSLYNDLELVSKYKETGDKSFVGELFKRHTALVFGVCMKYLKDEDNSKDAVMAIFEKLITDLLKQEITYFKTWLYSVSKNYCLMQMRSDQSRFNKIQEIGKSEAGFMEFEPPMHLNGIDEKEEKLVALEKGIQLLNEEQKKCIELFFIKEKCYTEIVAITGFSLNEVKSYIQNGKRNLKNYLINRE